MNMPPEPTELETKTTEELSVQLKEMFDLVEQQTGQIKAFGEVKADLAAKIEAQDERVMALSEELNDAKSRSDELEAKFNRPGHGGNVLEFQSVGDQFISSEHFKAMQAEEGRTCKKVAVKGILSRAAHALALKTLTSDALSAGALVTPDRIAEIIAPPDRALRLRDLITVGQTTSDQIEYAEETGFSNLYTVLTTAAIATDTDVDIESSAGFYAGQVIDIGGEAVTVATVASTTNITFAPALSGGHAIGVAVTSRFFAPTAETTDKPQGNITYEEKTAGVKTIAHWIPASRQILADATQLRSQIDGRLIFGLGLSEEEQILYGDGTGQSFLGIMANPAVQTYSWSAGAVGDTKIDAIRKAMTLARVAEFPISGTVLHPNDWEDVELVKGSDKHYIWVNVNEGGEMRLWRVPIVETTAIRPGEGLTGAFALGATIFDRESASIRVAEQHAGFFVQNMVAVLAEQREAFVTWRPEAFVNITFDAAPS
jgi:HK97 family phage major capsid protein